MKCVMLRKPLIRVDDGLVLADSNGIFVDLASVYGPERRWYPTGTSAAATLPGSEGTVGEQGPQLGLGQRPDEKQGEIALAVATNAMSPGRLAAIVGLLAIGDEEREGLAGVVVEQQLDAAPVQLAEPAADQVGAR